MADKTKKNVTSHTKSPTVHDARNNYTKKRARKTYRSFDADDVDKAFKEFFARRGLPLPRVNAHLVPGGDLEIWED